MSDNNALSSMDAALNRPLLSPSNIQYLERTGQFYPASPASGGHITISTQSYSTSPSPPDSTPTAVELPKLINSVEVLIFCGFTSKAATEIFTRFRNHLNGRLLGDLDDFMKGYIEEKSSTHGDGIHPAHDWDVALRNMGITEEKRVTIFKPEFKIIRETETASYWA